MRNALSYLRYVVRDNNWYVAKVGGVGVVGGLVLWACLYFAAKKAGIIYCIVLGLAAVVLVTVIYAGRALRPPMMLEDPAPETASASPYADLYFLEYRLSWGTVERSRFEQRVRPLLARLAEERLVQRHGIDRHRDPERARVVVGEQLWVLMTGPADPEAKAPSAREVGQWVDRIEAI